MLAERFGWTPEQVDELPDDFMVHMRAYLKAGEQIEAKEKKKRDKAREQAQARARSKR